MIYRFDEFELIPERLELRHAGVPLDAPPLVVRLLTALVLDAGQLVTKPALIARVWDDRAVSDNVITVAMARLRRTLGQQSGEREFVANEHGRGYRFVCPVERIISAPYGERLAGPMPASSPFVGRETVLAQLHAAFRDAQRGRGSACLLLGEPGIGKTRVAEELAAELGQIGVPVAWGHCADRGVAPPLWPFAEIVRGLKAFSALPRAARGVDELRWLDSACSPGERPESKHQAFEAILGAIEAASAAAPVLLVIDDLHRADETTAELLRYWVDRIGRTRVLLVCTLRPDSSTALGPVLGHCNSVRLPLVRLGLDAVVSYVRTLFDERDDTLGRAVFAKSEGIPFFMVELARSLTAVAQPDARSLRVPEAALELVRPRVLALDAEARGVLSKAAVLGRTFELSTLQAVLSCDTSTLMARLDAATVAQVVVPASDARTSFGFGHELQRQLLYDALPPGERRRLHGRVAEVLATQRRMGETIAPATLAHHLYAALPDADVDEVVAACTEAADRARQLYAYADAGRFLRHAREALRLRDGSDPVLRMKLLWQQAVYARVSAEPEFLGLAYELAQLGREYRAGACIVHAGLLLDMHPGFPPLPAARNTLEEGLALLPADDDEHRGAALAHIATMGPVAFTRAKSEALLSAALRHAAASGALIAQYASWLAELYAFGGPQNDSRAAFAMTEVERLCREHPGILTVPPILLQLHRAIVALGEGPLDPVHETLSCAAKRAQELGSRELVWHVERFQLLARREAAEASSAPLLDDALRELHARAREQALVATAPFRVHDEVVVLGQPLDEGEAHHVLARDADDPPSVWALKLRTLLAAGRYEAARAALHAVESTRLTELPMDRDYLGTLATLARAAVILEEPERQQALYVLLRPYASRFAVGPSFLCDGPMAHHLGELARALGRSDEAHAHFTLAVELSERAGHRRCATRASHERTRTRRGVLQT